MLSLIVAVIEFFVVLGVTLAAVLLNTIDARGFLASSIVGFAIIYGGGFQWFVIVAVFFILGVAFTLYEYGYKKKIGAAQDKGGARNWPNILANGGLASIVSVWNFVEPSTALAMMFLGAISASAADTAATELGLLSHSRPRLITHPKTGVSPGTSGGVSPLGFVGAAFGSLVIGLMAFFLGIFADPLVLIPVCLVGGLLGAIADSLIGAAVQRRGVCVICLKPTEALKHCGETTRLTAGFPIVENNVVNVFSTLVGAASSAVLFVAISPML